MLMRASLKDSGSTSFLSMRRGYVIFVIVTITATILSRMRFITLMKTLTYQMDSFLVLQIFNTFSERRYFILLCMQYQLEEMEELFSITSIGQSIKVRILQRAKRLHLSVSDLL